MAALNNSPNPGRRAAALAAAAGALAFSGAILAAGFGSAGYAQADALCDQMRAQHGPSWPCISVPTYTPPPTMNAPTTTPGAPGTSNGGAVIGGDAGPGPGTGNGTPIVGGRTQDQNRTGRTGAPTGPRTPAPATVTPNRPGEPANNVQSPVPADDTVGRLEQSPSDQAFLSPASDDDGSIPLPVWAIAGAAAVAAASLRRSPGSRPTKFPARNTVAYDRPIRGGRRVAPPTGPSNPPRPGDALYRLYLELTEYRRNYWDGWNHSPIGKEIHHAIEQVVWNRYPGVFESWVKDDPWNLRGIWMSAAPYIHQSVIRRAWNMIYDRLKDLGILPDEPGEVSEPAASIAREALLYWAMVVDVLFGDELVPTPSVLNDNDLAELLRSLGLSEEEIAEFAALTNEQKLILLRMLLAGWTGSLLPFGDYYEMIERESPPPPSRGTEPVEESGFDGTGDEGALESGQNGAEQQGGGSGEDRIAALKARMNADVDEIAAASKDLQEAIRSGDLVAQEDAQGRLDDAANRFEYDRSLLDIEFALRDLEYAQGAGDMAAMQQAMDRLGEAVDRYERTTGNPGGSGLDTALPGPPVVLPGDPAVPNDDGTFIPLPNGPAEPNIIPIPTTPTTPKIVPISPSPAPDPGKTYDV